MLQFGHGGDAVGDASSRSYAAARAMCFNSATAVTPWVTAWQGIPLALWQGLQFGHGGDAVGDVTDDMVKRTLIQLQFGHGGDAVGDTRHRHRRRLHRHQLQFGHGGDAVGDCPYSWYATGAGCFNSATAVTPWVTSRFWGWTFSAILLQFGHGGDAVGDPAAPAEPLAGLTLQFGHGGDAVGDSKNRPFFRPAIQLQFGHGGDAVGDDTPLPPEPPPVEASIRPRR